MAIFKNREAREESKYNKKVELSLERYIREAEEMIALASRHGNKIEFTNLLSPFRRQFLDVIEHAKEKKISTTEALLAIDSLDRVAPNLDLSPNKLRINKKPILSARTRWEIRQQLKHKDYTSKKTYSEDTHTPYTDRASTDLSL